MAKSSGKLRSTALLTRREAPSGAIRNTKLLNALDVAQMQNTWLIKGNGYFYVLHNNEPLDSIYVNSFNQLSIPEWVDEIKRIVSNG